MRKLVILGATGNIGEQTQEVLLENPNDFKLIGISIGKQIEKIDDILNKFPSIGSVCIKDYNNYVSCKQKYPHINFYYGDEGLISLIDSVDVDMVVNALVGFVGFLPSLHTVSKGIDLALANKESLVIGGDLIKQELAKTSSKLFAIDSEHVAISKCLEGKNFDQVKKLVLTASGGSFRDYSIDKLKQVTIKEALNHPSWSMGDKITLDSATMMNKAFEIIEAMHLFNCSFDQIDILMHDESIIHSLVEFNDNSFLCDLGPVDMKIAISYALYQGERKKVNVKPLDFTELKGLHFRKLDLDKYPCLNLAYNAIKMGGSAMCVLNRSNQEAVYSFLNGEISYLDIAKVIEYVLSQHQLILHPTKEEIIEVDIWAKNKSEEMIRRIKNGYFRNVY